MRTDNEWFYGCWMLVLSVGPAVDSKGEDS